jgi:uncharacterized protein involved in exopolysaccharide biosynthesis
MQKKDLKIEQSIPINGNPYVSPTYEDDEIDLYELWLILKKRAKTMLITTLLLFSLAVAYIFIKPPVYKTETTIFPLGGKKEGVSSFLANLPIALPSSAPSTLTVETVLKSRLLRERIVKKLNLLPILYASLWDEKRKTWKKDIEKVPTVLDGAEKLKKLISVSTDKKTGVITLSIEFPKDPKMAYKIAKVALEEAQKILNEKSWSLAKKQRIFLENQIRKALKKWKLLEEIYSEFLQGKIKDVPLIVDENFINQLLVKNENSTAVGSDLKLGKWKRELEKVSIGVPASGNISQYQFNYQKLQWQMNLLQNILTALFQQYEVAKANEIKEQVAFQIIDPPYVPEKDNPYKPKKVLILTVATVSGLFLGIFLAFFIEWLEETKKRYQNAEAGNE